jgi:hypothetical protein
VDIGHHRRKWKSPILGVALIVLRDIFWLLFFLRTWNPNFFFIFARENSPVQPLLLDPGTPCKYAQKKKKERRSRQGTKMTLSQNTPINERRVRGHPSNPISLVQPRNILVWIRATRPHGSSVLRDRGAQGTPHRDTRCNPPDRKWKRRAENTPWMEQTAVHGGYPPNRRARLR